MPDRSDLDIARDAVQQALDQLNAAGPSPPSTEHAGLAVAAALCSIAASLDALAHPKPDKPGPGLFAFA